MKAPAVTRLAEENWGASWSSSSAADLQSGDAGHIRSHGCRDLLVYCISGRCHHSNGDWLPDETPVRAFCSGMVCTRRG